MITTSDITQVLCYNRALFQDAGIKPDSTRTRHYLESAADTIQMGFYGNGERFPSVHEIARRYGSLTDLPKELLKTWKDMGLCVFAGERPRRFLRNLMRTTWSVRYFNIEPVC